MKRNVGKPPFLERKLSGICCDVTTGKYLFTFHDFFTIKSSKFKSAEMSLYFESLKPIEATPIKKWEENSKLYRSEMDARVDECTKLRNNSRRLRYETEVSKSWDSYYNNIKLENR